MPNDATTPITSTAIVDLDLYAVALCGQGANSRANIILTKNRKETNSMPKTFEELLKALTAEQAKIVTDYITDLNKTNEAKVATLQTKVDTLEKNIPAPTPAPQPNTEEMFKNVAPELRTMVEKMQKTIDSFVQQDAENLAKSRYEACKALPVEEVELKEVLKSASPKVVEILQKASKAIAEGIEKAKGVNGDGTLKTNSADDQYDVLTKAANAIIAKSTGKTFEDAFTEACTQNPDVYKKYREGVR